MKLTNEYGLPESIVNAVSRPSKDFSDKSISVTRLIDSPRILRLLKENESDIVEDVTSRLWILLGNAVHDYLNKHTSKDVASEVDIHMFVGDTMLTGIPDVVYPLSTDPTTGKVIEAEVHDYKVTSAWSFLKGVKPEWEKQLNVYAAILNKLGIKIKGIKIIAILRDWNEMEASRNASYPRVPMHILEVPLWDESKGLEYISERMGIHEWAKNAPLEEVHCSDEEKWMKPNTYAVVRPSVKRAVRVFATKELADKYVAENTSIEKPLMTVERKGDYVRCSYYCPVRNLCSERSLPEDIEDGERKS